VDSPRLCIFGLDNFHISLILLTAKRMKLVL
jgi:hypothetical protein